MSESPSGRLGRLAPVPALIVLVAVAYFVLAGGDEEAVESAAEPEAPAAPVAAAPAPGQGSASASAPDSAPDATEQAEGGFLRVAPPPSPIAFGTTIDDEPLELPDIPWESLSEAARGEAFETSVETLPDWIAELDPEYDAQYLGVDCSAPPCVVGMAFDGTSFGDDHVAKAGFQSEFNDELMRLRGVRPAMTMVTATPDGTTAVWLYELPARDADGLHADLNESAKLRHQEWAKAWSAARAGRLVP